MPISGADKVMQQGQQQLQRIAEISMNIRKAVRSALPAPPEQFFTMMVPGKVLNFNVSPFPPRRASWLLGVLIWHFYPAGFHRRL